MRRFLYDTLVALTLACGAGASCSAGDAGTALADGTRFAPRPAVVELFTSEGCSSCPPADAYIGELTRRSDVLALTFHVDYWDDLGWRDPFALRDGVQRQRKYVRALGRRAVYTPEVVVDGEADFVGSDRAAIGKALARPRDGIGMALAMRDGHVLIELNAHQPGMASEVLLIAYRRAAVSAVKRGENAGRTLSEYNIVREIRSLGRWGGEHRNFHTPGASLPPDATDIAVLVQLEGQGSIIGAASMTIAERGIAMNRR